jgi:hypothetical protein
MGSGRKFTLFFYIVFLSMLSIDVSLVSEKISPVDTIGKSWFLNSFIFVYVAILLITGIKFSLETIKFDDIEMRIKGKFLLIAFPSFSLAGILDSSLPSNQFTLIIFRGILITSIILFFIGFLLPKFIKKRILK